MFFAFAFSGFHFAPFRKQKHRTTLVGTEKQNYFRINNFQRQRIESSEQNNFHGKTEKRSPPFEFAIAFHLWHCAHEKKSHFRAIIKWKSIANYIKIEPQAFSSYFFSFLVDETAISLSNWCNFLIEFPNNHATLGYALNAVIFSGVLLFEKCRADQTKLIFSIWFSHIPLPVAFPLNNVVHCAHANLNIHLKFAKAIFRLWIRIMFNWFWSPRRNRKKPIPHRFISAFSLTAFDDDHRKTKIQNQMSNCGRPFGLSKIVEKLKQVNQKLAFHSTNNGPVMRFFLFLCFFIFFLLIFPDSGNYQHMFHGKWNRFSLLFFLRSTNSKKKNTRKNSCFQTDREKNRRKVYLTE